MEKIKLLLADRRQIFREGLVRLLELEPSIEVVCVCRTGSEAIEALTEYEVDVIAINTDLFGDGTIEALRHVHQMPSKVAIITLTHSKGGDEFLSVFSAGARGYISEDIGIENLVRIIHLAADGEVIVIPLEIARLLWRHNYLNKYTEIANLGYVALLSKRETVVLSLVAQGLTNRDIAAILFISELTVKVHLRNIMEKLHAQNRQQAVLLAGGKDLLGKITGADLE